MHVQRLPSVHIEASSALSIEPAPTCDEAAAQEAYAVPWRIQRATGGQWLSVVNVGGERLTFVQFVSSGFGEPVLSLPVHVNPQEGVQVVLTEMTPLPQALLILRWRRPNGEEYVWPVGV